MKSRQSFHYHHQSETVKKFKLKFENRMKKYKEKVDALVTNTGFSGNWRDLLISGGVSAAALTGGIVISIVAGASAVVTGGASLALGVGVIASSTIYTVLRAKKKMKEYTRVSDLLQRDDFDNKVAIVADILSEMYQFQLKNCSSKHAELLADACFKSLKNEMRTNKNVTFRDLLVSSHLQALIVKSADKVKKQPISINGNEDEKANSRGAITHAGLYCEENEQFYRYDKSKPAKYGVLFFATRHELDDYKLKIEAIKRDNDSWHIDKMPASQVKILIRNDLFHAPVDDETYRAVADDSDERATEEHTSEESTYEGRSSANTMSI